MEPPPLYYRTRVMDINVRDISSMCADLLEAKRYVPAEGYDLQLWKWLQWFFQENPPASVTSALFLPNSVLVTRISKMAGSPLHQFCVELARERHTHLEGHENGTLLTFLKTIYRGDHPRKRGTRM